MDKDVIEAFLQEMRERHNDEIDAIEMPEGTLEYLQDRAAKGDIDTLMFMLKLGYLMGLQTGYAAYAAEDEPPPNNPFGPLKA